MSALPYLLPWILLLLGIGLAAAVKLLPLKSIAGIAVNVTLLLIMLGVAIYANVIRSQQVDLLAEKDNNLAEMEQWKYSQLDKLTLILAQLRPPKEEELALMHQLISFGWVSGNPNILRAQQAHQARERLLESHTVESRMLIKGIPLTVDSHIVELALKEIGFIVLPYREDEQPEADANILYFGRDMTLPEIKLAALTLMQAGVDVKAIKPFPKATQGNLRAVKIEWNKYYEGRKSLAVEEVETAKGFN
ncbi:MAG: hypothetical protein VYA55_10880 [Pseudomonadota bacterium]|nr:hypothetical protein [Pseudomonadota bacterium]